ncbi:hypothetical protein OG818_03965 [Streptomyces virginiae]|uniref:hypothetical protein n=1 Tax=Streptomyces virginiae TaxID=1961 RepID=UPI0022565030|nr:hypothetical protein [Streptomyces virginiae]MCX4714952.1 hypothetical protein [Streptomyces virginiae]
MSEIEILQMAAPAAQALLACMTSDAWQAAKSKFAALLGRNNQVETEILENDLEEARVRIMQNPAEHEAITSEVWKARFRQALLANPDMAQELREILREFKDQEPNSSRGIHQSVVARDSSIVFQQGSGVQNYNNSPGSNA